MFLYRLRYGRGQVRLIDVMCEGDAKHVAASETQRTGGWCEVMPWDGERGEYICSTYFDLGNPAKGRPVEFYFMPGETWGTHKCRPRADY